MADPARQNRGTWLGWLGAGEDPDSASASDSTSSGLTVQNPDSTDAPRKAQVFVRLWLGFMTARVMVAVVLIILPWALSLLRAIPVPYIAWGGWAYLLLALVQRWQVGTQRRVQFSQHLVGVCVVMDVLAISLLNDAPPRVVNYYPLLALPLLYVSILGTRMQAMGTGAALSLLLLVDVWLQEPSGDLSAQFFQAALKGLGAMVGAWLVNQLATRLDQEIRNAQVNRTAARTQIRVNELVMDEMTQGVLVADESARVRIANPSALGLMGLPADTAMPLPLENQEGLTTLCEFVRMAFAEQTPQIRVVEIRVRGAGVRGLRLRSRLTVSSSADGQDRYLCVVFMEDVQEVQARVRQEKMAAMGRMSAAVAHEIRNPLTAIVQANALLQEEISDDRLRRMTGIVAQNAQRIAQTVDEVLDVSRIPRSDLRQISLLLQQEVAQVCADWATMHGITSGLDVVQTGEMWRVRFESEHLRRLLINLLDNGIRHSVAPDPRVVVWVGVVETVSGPSPALAVWNRGEPLDATIEQHLFEPFFSSQSRSSGLGLYICRQLCEWHEAEISFSRSHMPTSMQVTSFVQGNQFMVRLQWAHHELAQEPQVQP